MSHWRAMASRLQREALATLPPDATLKEKSKAICDAWPSQMERKRWPYTMWCIVRREMLDLSRIKLGEARKRSLKNSGIMQGRMF